MKSFLVIGASSGIGRSLSTRLVKEGNKVIGVARRKKLLENLRDDLSCDTRFFPIDGDISQKSTWRRIVENMKRLSFYPDAIIFCAAVFSNDLLRDMNLTRTREIFATNYFGILEGVKRLLSVVAPGAQFIVVSSSSAFKGSRLEGIGYPSSKAALSIAFESLHLKYKGTFFFKTVFLGPVAAGMGQFRKEGLLVLSEKQAVNKICEAALSRGSQFYQPLLLFVFLRIIRLFPSVLYFSALSLIEDIHIKMKVLK